MEDYGVLWNDRDRLRNALRTLVLHIEDMDIQATKLTDGEWVTGYQFNTGSWHRILGLVRGGQVATALTETKRLEVLP